MLADPAAAEEVAKGIAQGMGEGKGYVDISTIDGDTANRIKDVCPPAALLPLSHR